MDRPQNYTAIDLEMTGLSPKLDRIIEIGAVRVRNRQMTETYAMLVNPGLSIPQKIVELTGITDEMVQSGKPMDEAVSGLLDFIGEDIIVGQNVGFDYSFLKQWAVNKKRPLELRAYDTLHLARKLLPPEQSKTLEALCGYFGVTREHAHRALDDTIETMQVFEKLFDLAELEGKPETEPKVLTYKAKRQTPATIHQVKKLKELREQYQFTDPVNWEILTRSEASRLHEAYRQKIRMFHKE